MKYEIKKLSVSDFPPLLNEIPDKPSELFYAGQIPKWSENIFLTVVGSRKYTSYGKDVCINLIGALRGLPVVIVSGLALGTDALAHETALKNELTTIAIPGSGIHPDVIYPRTNFYLAQKILESGGMLLSEYEPHFKATLWSFPKRNRILAGISHATLLIEANEKSGTLITARLTTEYNRDLIVVPGSIFSDQSRGTHQFLKLGATPVTCGQDLREALGFTDTQVENNPQTKYENCSAEELLIIEILNEPTSRNTIAEILQKPINTVSITLSMLELKGHIKESGGKIYKI
jgi:DNA processing protein